MFTGIVSHPGRIISIKRHADAMHLQIESEFSNLVLGESIAIDGICLTVVDFNGGLFSCDISPETLNVTTANSFSEGKAVNLERALQLSDRVGGHFVMGHIDKVLKVHQKQYHDEFLEITFTGFNAEEHGFLVKKGSVAINGVSLTINVVSREFFSVMLIPHTLERTNLPMLNVNDAVNVEFDYLARIVSHQLECLKEANQ